VAVVAGIAVGVALDRIAVHTLVRPTPPSPPSAGMAAAPANPAPQPGAEPVYRVPLEDSPQRGPKAALVTIVESSDFECPFCKRVAPTLKQIESTYGSEVRFVFKHNPLSMHPSALPAAKLAEEARAEGGDARFWALHDKLFALPALDRAALEKAGQEVGLSAAAVRTALDEPRHLDRIQRDQNLVSSLGASGTPSFFVNGRKFVGAQPFEAFKAVIDEELAKARTLVRSGVAPADVYARTTEKGATAAVAAAAAPAPAPAARVALRTDDPVRGPQAAPVTLVLFSDFQCPFCSRVEPTVKQIRDRYGDKVRIAWKHLPLPFHPNAMPAARAAEAARQQGRFWEMHDKLFADQAALSEPTYARYAKELGLDADRFGRDAAAEATARRIAEDMQVAAGVGATGTPTAFVNCRRVVGAQPFESFARVVDEELTRAEGMEARGTKLDGKFYEKICDANLASPLAAAR